MLAELVSGKQISERIGEAGQYVQPIEHIPRYGISLPEDCRRFLLYIGNGGAGPYYGMFRLEDSLEHKGSPTAKWATQLLSLV